VCYRLWSEGTQRGLIAQPIPEIRSADLAPLALELAAWGVAEVTTLAWLDPPPAGALAQARSLLTELDALDGESRITAAGRAMVALPVHPRLAHLLAQASNAKRTALACDIAALLSERDILTREARRSCDLSERIEGLAAFRHQGRGGAQAHHADANACARVDQAARQLRRLVRCEKTDASIAADDVGLLLAAAYPDRIAQQRTPGETSYLLSNGRGARLPYGEMRLRAPYLVAASLDAGEGEGIIYLAAALPIDVLRVSCASRLKTDEVVRWDNQQQAVVARREQRLGALVIESRALSDADPEKLRSAMLDGLGRLGLEALPWTPELRQWQARVLSLRAWCPEEALPDVSDAHLLATLETWLGPYLDGVTRRDHLVRIDLASALKGMLDWSQAKRLDEGAPTHLSVPSGSRLRIEYASGESPVLAVKLQEMFGCADTPRVAFGRVPVTLHLLSPARRPIQVTQDLRGFWDRTYAEVKKELKGRYPKHPWPDDPWNAVPTRRTRPR
jgi:ATP-dependent helicase HrpB